MIEFALVGAGGVLGALARHLLGERVETRFLDTLLVNLLGSFAFGFLLGFEGEAAFLVFGIGFCGAFTTFSTFAFETVRLFETGERQLALANATTHLVGAVAAVFVGVGVAGLAGLDSVVLAGLDSVVLAGLDSVVLIGLDSVVLAGLDSVVLIGLDTVVLAEREMAVVEVGSAVVR